MGNTLFGNQTHDLEFEALCSTSWALVFVLLNLFIYSFWFCLCELKGPLRTYKNH